jgi:hypothetical protein
VVPQECRPGLLALHLPGAYVTVTDITGMPRSWSVVRTP